MKMWFAEHRLIGRLFEHFGENMKTYGRDLNEQYLSGPWKRNDPIQKIAGPLVAAGSVVLEGTDQLWAGMVGQKLEKPSGLAGRTRRDLALLAKDIVTLHPLRAIGDGFRLALADLWLDGGDAIGGFRLDERSRMQQVLSKAEPHYAMAA